MVFFLLLLEVSKPYWGLCVVVVKGISRKACLEIEQKSYYMFRYLYIIYNLYNIILSYTPMMKCPQMTIDDCELISYLQKKKKKDWSLNKWLKIINQLLHSMVFESNNISSLLHLQQNFALLCANKDSCFSIIMGRKQPIFSQYF